MSAKFRKSFKIAPGVRLNMGSKSAGLSFGTKGLRYSINSRTGGRMTARIPGTPISYSTSTSKAKRKYNSSAYKQKEALRMQKEQQKLEAQQQAQYEVAYYENQIELIKSIHKECDEPIYWDSIAVSEPPYIQGSQGVNEVLARQNLEKYKPGLLEKLLKSDSKRLKLIQAIEEAITIDKDEFVDWERLVNVAKKINSGDIDAYFSVIEELSPLDDLSEFGSGFTFITDDPSYLEVEFQINSENVLPQEVKSLTSTGKLSTKAISKSKYYDLEQDYVCSCALRIARDMFAILPLNYIIVHATNSILNSSNGQREDITVLSVKIDKATLNTLDFENIDCSDSMQNFDHKMKFLKTSGFQPVSRIHL